MSYKQVDPGIFWAAMGEQKFLGRNKKKAVLLQPLEATLGS